MKVSVALCTYNGERYIEEQITSILNQSIKPDEIVICDDNSTDRTIQLAKGILVNSTIEFKIEVNNTNMGVVENFQKAIELTKGDIIFLSDQDDIWNTKKIELIKNEFEKDKSCMLTFTDAYLVNSKREKLGVNLWDTLEFSDQMLKNSDLLDILLNRCIVTGATMAIKRELFNNVKPFQNSWIHDGWLAINAPLYGTVKAIKTPLIEYRQHNNNVIGATKVNYFERVKKYFENISILDNVRNNRYNRYKTFYDFNSEKLDNEIKGDISECIAFWDNMRKMSNVHFLKGLVIIVTNTFRGNYKRYYTGLRGAIRDVVYLFTRMVVK